MTRRVFRDPVHGLIEFDGDNEPLAAIMETRAMQRLRRIRQMGFAPLVYTGAEHSRFGHAMGAFHIACRVVAGLQLSPEITLHVKVAALLHDIGHGPFSHAWEQAFGGEDHESWGARIVAEDEELNGVLRGISPDLPESLAGFWDKSYAPSFARKLVSSQLDVDRLDYLLRDGHYSGAGYATYDLDWIIHAMQIAEIHEGPDSRDLVIDYRRGMYAVEQYLFARSYMYAQVYHHKTVRAAEWMFLKLMRRFAALCQSDNEPKNLPIGSELGRGQAPSVASYLCLDDYRVVGAIDEWAGQGPSYTKARDPVLSDLAARLVNRRLFKTIDLGDDPAIIDEIRGPVRQAAQGVFGEHAGSYVEIDTARQAAYAPGGGEELHVVGHPRHGTVTLSRLMDDVPLGRPVSVVRLVCAPELVEVLRPIVETALRG